MVRKRRIYMFAARGKRPIFRKLTTKEARFFNYGPGAEGKWYERGVMRTVSPVTQKQAEKAIERAKKRVKRVKRRKAPAFPSLFG